MASERTAGFEELLVQLRMANALLAMTLQRQHELTQREIIGVLAGTNAPAAEIAAVLGTTVNTVRVTLSGIRAGSPRLPKEK